MSELVSTLVAWPSKWPAAHQHARRDGGHEQQHAKLAHPLHHHGDRHPLDGEGVARQPEVDSVGRDGGGGQVEPVEHLVRVGVGVRVALGGWGSVQI